MTILEHDFLPGNLVRARGREWVVQSEGIDEAEVIHALVFSNREGSIKRGNWLLRPMANIELPRPSPKAINGNSSDCWETGTISSKPSTPARSRSNVISGRRPLKRR